MHSKFKNSNWVVYHHRYIYICVLLLDPPYTTVYNVTVSSSLTPTDLSGFDIIISWTVSNEQQFCDGLLYIAMHIHLVFVIIAYPQKSGWIESRKNPGSQLCGAYGAFLLVSIWSHYWPGIFSVFNSWVVFWIWL